MNYFNVYKSLIRKAKREGRKRGKIYYERHHIIPKSLGGSNRTYNLVLLTAKEHFIAHMLLWKICKSLYGVNDIKTHKMLYAISFFVNKAASSQKYDLLKREISQMRRGKDPWNKGRIGSMAKFGLKRTEKQKERYSLSKIGDKNPAKRQEVRDKISKNSAMSKKCYIDDREFNSISEAAHLLNTTNYKARKMITKWK